ncbi:MAG: tetratricopeptide repeat protein [Deltaproteobacteria bacterium]|nr:tetratricopeptide repeat protein [Deltaproteobacteria bacterium]
MRPLDSLPRLEELLRRAAATDVAGELQRLEAEELEGVALAARAYGQGAFALRDGRTEAALDAFEQAESLFERAGDREAAELASCERWLARIRRGATSAEARGAGVGYHLAIDALESLASAASTRRARVVASHYVAVAQRAAGRAEETQERLLSALRDSDGLLPERAQILNSLGTLYVLMGAHGAARALLEHAADLARQLGDAQGEAIACGQLGTASIALGEREVARRHFQRQEWLASRIGDVFGRARARTFLAELALELGRPDEACEHASTARELAESVTPPLTMWVGYATRLRARARLELGERAASAELEEAEACFRRIGNRLGVALVTWDRARHGLGDDWAGAAWAIGGLGLEQRVAELLLDRRRSATEPGLVDALDGAIAACTGSFAHLASAHELELLYQRPDVLASQSARRFGGQRNLGRLAALVLSPPGLVVATLVHPELGEAGVIMPPRDGQAVSLGAAPGLVCWAWRRNEGLTTIMLDLAHLKQVYPSIRGALVGCDAARITGLPVEGEGTVRHTGIPSHALLARALAAAEGALDVDAELAPSSEALAAWSAPSVTP